MEKFAQRIHADLIGPTKESVNGSTYLFNTLDEATGLAKAAGLTSKLPPEVLKALQDLYRGHLHSGAGLRTDNGGEFMMEFEDFLRYRNVRHEHSLPNRPQTNSIIERWNYDVCVGNSD